MGRMWIALPALALLAACGGSEEGTSISIESDNGAVAADAAEDGTLSLKTPGFQGSIKLPKIKIGSDNFEFDGVKLYPGTRITNIKIVDNPSATDVGGVNVTFEAPAEATRVRDWFRTQMEGAGFTVNGRHEELTGRTASGSAFTLYIDPKGTEKSIGRLNVRGE